MVARVESACAELSRSSSEGGEERTDRSEVGLKSESNSLRRARTSLKASVTRSAAASRGRASAVRGDGCSEGDCSLGGLGVV